MKSLCYAMELGNETQISGRYEGVNDANEYIIAGSADSGVDV